MTPHAIRVPHYPGAFRPEEGFAREFDAGDPLAHYRDRFFLPRQADGRPVTYFASHSLGLQPRAVRPLIERELEQWTQLGVEGHFQGPAPWYTYQDLFRASAARLVGAKPDEVVFMNGLTINLHLMLATFFRPRASRCKILIEEPAFPSDLYAVKSQLQYHGLDPGDALLTVKPRGGEQTLRTEDIEAFLAERGSDIALVLWSGINFLTGQVFDMARIAAAARPQGCVVGLDLAHAVGNVPLSLHDWQVDFAVWCSYKYLNSGPGAVAGCFVHEVHGRRTDLPRLAGWWGNDPAKRFRMQLEPDFVAQPGAGGWQVSNPPILALVPVRASLALFDEAGMPSLRAKSACLTGYLQYLLDQLPPGPFEVVTPREPAARGCQLSLRVRERPRELLHALEEEGIVGDFREPDIIRVAPVPFYNTFHEVWAFARVLARHTA